MKRSIAILAAVAALTLTSATASADMGTFTATGGEMCSWYGYGSSASVDCAGYSRSAGGYINYHCDYTFFGSSYSYTCRSINGATWSGSR